MNNVIKDRRFFLLKIQYEMGHTKTKKRRLYTDPFDRFIEVVRLKLNMP